MAQVWGRALSGFPGWTVHWGLRMMFGAQMGLCRKALEPALSAHGGWCTQGAVGKHACHMKKQRYEDQHITLGRPKPSQLAQLT